MDAIQAADRDPSDSSNRRAPRTLSSAPRPASHPSSPPAGLGDDSTPGAWLLVWTIVTVKTITLVVTIAVARSWDAGAVMALTTWPWLAAVGAIVAGPLLFRYRLRRVRARRAAFLRAEWEVDADPPAADEQE